MKEGLLAYDTPTSVTRDFYNHPEYWSVRLQTFVQVFVTLKHATTGSLQENRPAVFLT